LLSVLTSAKPKIANYPFTTINPNLGVANYNNKEVTLADIPGLIEGAHEGIGLGDKFLRHIERCKNILHLIDITNKNVLESYYKVRKELSKYSNKLIKKREIIVLNKVDMISEEEINEKINTFKKGLKKEIKSDNTPVTNGDIEVNNILTKKISTLTPKIPIISEETSSNKKNENLSNFWLIDPIDGTSSYINNKDEFTINAALIINKKPALGVIYAPDKKRLFYSYGPTNSFEIVNNKEVRLIDKNFMGELFKVMLLTNKNIKFKVGF